MDIDGKHWVQDITEEAGWQQECSLCVWLFMDDNDCCSLGNFLYPVIPKERSIPF